MPENGGDRARQEDYRAIFPFNPNLIVMSFIILLFEWIIVRLQGLNS